MNSDRLTAALAERVMHWGVAPDRFLIGDRRWMPRWRFQPAKRLEDAFRLLDVADPDEYSITSHRGGPFAVRVQIRGAIGEAHDAVKPRAIAHAVARAIGLDPGGSHAPTTSVERK